MNWKKPAPTVTTVTNHPSFFHYFFSILFFSNNIFFFFLCCLQRFQKNGSLQHNFSHFFLLLCDPVKCLCFFRVMSCFSILWIMVSVFVFLLVFCASWYFFIFCVFLPKWCKKSKPLYTLQFNIYITKCELITMMAKMNKIVKKIAKRTGNENWFSEMGKYEQNVCKDIMQTMNIGDATETIIRKYF